MRSIQEGFNDIMSEILTTFLDSLDVEVRISIKNVERESFAITIIRDGEPTYQFEHGLDVYGVLATPTSRGYILNKTYLEEDRKLINDIMKYLTDNF